MNHWKNLITKTNCFFPVYCSSINVQRSCLPVRTSSCQWQQSVAGAVSACLLQRILIKICTLQLIQHMRGCLRKPHCIPLAHKKLVKVTIRIFRMAARLIQYLYEHEYMYVYIICYVSFYFLFFVFGLEIIVCIGLFCPQKTLTSTLYNHPDLCGLGG